ncbi:chromophore lyase CpcT/CpeT [Leptolyngbya sp. FACHB-36]|uniref:chromophore lyase CpcT/CpeT n=1 Tax=Leptolyngbya sp. FACHB-36 TaxID=2692808 RepID=UPI00168169B6|nr:chromophore lyase CpcT/CpeT [Leptolyngbya sp. FACHB-36]MBD2022197.1 chromophore lyase CpcT/CpeT [Leptolyngbya sp. FACHB-36]
MALSPTLLQLANYLTGEFDNQEQAMADPAWFVHLRQWHCPIALFTDDSFTIFAEQANIVKLDQPYRQRLLRLKPSDDAQSLQVQYYGFHNPAAIRGAGQRPEMLERVTIDSVELLPGCILQVIETGDDRFVASPPADARCYFSYEGETRQVILGFESSPTEFFSYDKGVDPKTGATLWGALMGPYRFTKRQHY